MERLLGPLEEIERAVQERAKDISLDMRGAGKDKLRALIDEEVARWSDDYRRGLRAFDLADPDIVAERAYPQPRRLRPARSRCSTTTTCGRS